MISVHEILILEYLAEEVCFNTNQCLWQLTCFRMVYGSKCVHFYHTRGCIQYNAQC